MAEEQPARIWVSAEITGTGSAQSTAHTLERVPERVLVFLTGGPASYAQPTITQGTHTGADVVVTVTTGWKYRVLAWG
jgi:hypothetical protein